MPTDKKNLSGTVKIWIENYVSHISNKNKIKLPMFERQMNLNAYAFKLLTVNFFDSL